MAWVDDRLWCHPKWLALSDKAKAVWVNGIAYSSGMGTRGHLTIEQQRLMGATPRVRAELVESGWWDENGDGRSVLIHDWEDHNGRRDAKREADRERKRRWRREHGSN